MHFHSMVVFIYKLLVLQWEVNLAPAMPALLWDIRSISSLIYIMVHYLVLFSSTHSLKIVCFQISPEQVDHDASSRPLSWAGHHQKRRHLLPPNRLLRDLIAKSLQRVLPRYQKFVDVQRSTFIYE